MHLPLLTFPCLCEFLTLPSLILAWAAIANYHRQSELKNKHLLSHISRAWKSKIKVGEWLSSGKGLISVSQTAIFLLCAQCWREKSASSSLLLRTPVPSCGLHSHDLMTSQKPHLRTPSFGVSTG